jgi:hypothetical protein
MSNRTFLSAAFAVCLSLLSASARADLVGTTATVNYEWPTLGTVLYSGGTQVITSSGTTFPVDSGDDPVTVTGSNLTLTFDDGWSFSTAPKTFDGIVLTDPGAYITGVSLAGTNITGFLASDVTFDAHDVYINFPYPPLSALNVGADVSVNIATAAATPEPSGLLLLGTGMLGGTWFYRRRQLA